MSKEKEIMSCKDCRGGSCGYNIMLPYYVTFLGDTPTTPETKQVTIDKCLLPEILYLWEKGIRTAGCCCGHGIEKESFIDVNTSDCAKMSKLGYVHCQNGWKSPTTFSPKTKMVYTDNVDKGHNWWDVENDA